MLIPLFFQATPLRFFSAIYGLTLLGLWLGGLGYIARQGRFFCLPKDPSLLRNMVYFPELRVAAGISELAAETPAATQAVSAGPMEK